MRTKERDIGGEKSLRRCVTPLVRIDYASALAPYWTAHRLRTGGGEHRGFDRYRNAARHAPTRSLRASQSVGPHPWACSRRSSPDAPAHRLDAGMTSGLASTVVAANRLRASRVCALRRNSPRRRRVAIAARTGEPRAPAVEHQSTHVRQRQSTPPGPRATPRCAPRKPDFLNAFRRREPLPA